MQKHLLTFGVFIALGFFVPFVPVSYAADGDFGGGDGSAESPLIIEDCLDLQAIAPEPVLYYELSGDIDCSATATDEETWGANGFDPLPGFSGYLDGKGYAIDGLFMSRGFSGYNGLFTGLHGGHLTNFGLTNIAITVDESTYAGTVAAEMSGGTISKVYVTGVITHNGSDDSSGTVGGFVGFLTGGTISDSYAIVDVIASSDADATTEYGGGFIGRSVGGTIVNAYAAGEVTAPVSGEAAAAAVGGFIGSGSSATVTDSFWDVDVSGQGTSADTEVGKTTEEMKARATFEDAGWDFESTWRIAAEVNSGYPYLNYTVASSGRRTLPEESTPTVTVLSPNGGEVFDPGSVQSIEYQVTGSERFVNILVSYDEEVSWTMLVNNVLASGTYAWQLPNISTNALIQVQLTDLATVIASDTSDALVRIGHGNTNDEVPSDQDAPVSDEPAESAPSEEVPIPVGQMAPSPYNGKMELVSVVRPNSYIKGKSYDTVYYVDEDFVRHAFYNEAIFATYESSFANVNIVTDATLPFLKMGSLMLPKTGSVLLKWESTNPVYAVNDEGRVLHRFAGEEVAVNLVGKDWADYVLDLPITMWGRFTVGADINTTDDHSINRSILRKRASLRIK